jgi:hypothetical protein
MKNESRWQPGKNEMDASMQVFYLRNEYLICPKKTSINTLDTRPKKKQHILLLIPTRASTYGMGAFRPITSTMASAPR